MARLSAGEVSLRDTPSDVLEVLRAVRALVCGDRRSLPGAAPEGRVDPSGLVKGWAVERVGRRLLAGRAAALVRQRRR